jgi:hypothetical protein
MRRGGSRALRERRKFCTVSSIEYWRVRGSPKTWDTDSYPKRFAGVGYISCRHVRLVRLGGLQHRHGRSLQGRKLLLTRVVGLIPVVCPLQWWRKWITSRIVGPAPIALPGWLHTMGAIWRRPWRRRNHQPCRMLLLYAHRSWRRGRQIHHLWLLNRWRHWWRRRDILLSRAVRGGGMPLPWLIHRDARSRRWPVCVVVVLRE